MNKEKNQFLPTLINKVKYSRKVKVADIKRYLVDEFKLTKDLDKQNKELKGKLEEAEELEKKYELTLVTLSEYKARIEERNKEIGKLEEKIEKQKRKINELENEKNDLELKTRNINLQIEKVIMKGLSIYSEDRYQTVNDMLEDLEEKTVSYFDDAFSEQNSDISNDFLPDDGAFFSSAFDGNEPYDKEADSEEMNNDFPDQSSDSTGNKKIAIIVLAALAVVVIIAAVIVFVSITKKNDYNNDKEYNTVDLTDYDQYTVDGFDASELIDETEAEKDNKISDNN